MKKDKVITESTKIYPRGRGKVLVISEKSVMPKPKNKKPNPSFLHSYIKSNPEPIKLKEYIGSDERKRIVLFPEGRILQRNERLDLGISLLISCAENGDYTLPDTSGMGRTYKFDRNVRRLANLKLRRYVAWRKRFQKKI